MACNLSMRERSKDIDLFDRRMNEEFEYLKRVFCQFSDLKLANQTSSTVNSFSIISDTLLSMIGSFLFPNNGSNVKDYDFLTKILLEGDRLSGKSSFLNCIVSESEITQNSIPPTAAFASKIFKFEQVRVKVELWETGGERYRPLIAANYRRVEFILLLIDPFNNSKQTTESINKISQDIKEYAPNNVEVILITTKKDITDRKRNFTNEQANRYTLAYGGLHFDIDNNQTEEPRNIILYCALLKYFRKSLTFYL